HTGRLDARGELRLTRADNRCLSMPIVHEGFAWKPEEFGPCHFCSDFDVTGLGERHRGFGLGVPLVCTRSADAPSPSRYLYPRGISFPVTAMLRFDGSVTDLQSTDRPGRLEFYDPTTIHALELAGRKVPLETDLTTPLAYFVSHSDLDGVEYLAFVHADHLR